jgi:hypothetical protein
MWRPSNWDWAALKGAAPFPLTARIVLESAGYRGPADPVPRAGGESQILNRLLAFCVATSAITGCAGTEDVPTAVVQSEELVRLVLEEDLWIGSRDDPRIGFSNIGTVALAGDGSLVVLERTDRQVRMYDPDSGDLVRAWGRGGSGPGEFQAPSWMGASGDTVWVGDMGLGRLVKGGGCGNAGGTEPRCQLRRFEFQRLRVRGSDFTGRRHRAREPARSEHARKDRNS